MSVNRVVDYEFSEESSTEPVSLQEAKDYCRIGITDDGPEITTMIKAARETLELYTRLSLIPRTVTAVICNPEGRIELPFGPITGTITFADATYESQKEFVGLGFKRVVAPTRDDMEVSYEAGYTDTNIPSDLKEAILAQILYMYEMRGDESTDTKGICNAAMRLAGKRSRITFFS